MAITYLKKSPKTSSTDDTKTTEIVKNLLKEIENSKEEACINLTKKFDKYDGEIIVSKERIEKIKKELDQKTKDDIQFSHERVRKFAEAQLKNYGQDFEVELSPGLFAGQKLIPVNTAGCYIPGGRYAHIASAVMSVTTAKVAGVKNIIACSPPKEGVGAHPAIVYTADLCGADVILNLGGVPGIAAMTNGLFKNPPADILVGPGNQFVAEAKRILFGKVGIDLFAGPTEIAVIADDKADAEMVAVDLVGQAEHGYNSPACLITNSEVLATETLKQIDRILKILPTSETARASWEDYGDVILCENHDVMLSVANEMAYEHVQVMTDRDQWYLDNIYVFYTFLSCFYHPLNDAHNNTFEIRHAFQLSNGSFLTHMVLKLQLHILNDSLELAHLQYHVIKQLLPFPHFHCYYKPLLHFEESAPILKFDNPLKFLLD